MRKIKFRGKSEGTGEWVYGNLVDSGGMMKKKLYSILIEDVSAYDEVERVIPDSVGEFIMMLPNNKELYENDIVELRNWGVRDNSIIGTAVMYWDIQYKQWDFHMIIGEYVEDQYDRWRQGIRVISNTTETKNIY